MPKIEGKPYKRHEAPKGCFPNAIAVDLYNGPLEPGKTERNAKRIKILLQPSINLPGDPTRTTKKTLKCDFLFFNSIQYHFRPFLISKRLKNCGSLIDLSGFS